MCNFSFNLRKGVSEDICNMKNEYEKKIERREGEQRWYVQIEDDWFDTRDFYCDVGREGFTIEKIFNEKRLLKRLLLGINL